MEKLIMTGRQAVERFVEDGDVVAVGGFVGAGHPEQLTLDLQKRYLDTAHPKDLTLIYAAGQGDGDKLGLNHFGEEGLVKKVIGGHFNLEPRLKKLILENKVAGYNLPQGVISKLFREIASGSDGLITKVGLKTFVDPRIEGGKLNKAAKEDIVELIDIKGEERLLYPSMKIDVAFIRASYADVEGNASLSKEGVYTESLQIAQATKNSGGKVILQVENVVEKDSLDARSIKIPGIYVDAIVIAEEENHKQTLGTWYNPAYSGEVREDLDILKPMELSVRKVIARRAAMELVPNSIVNLGIGMPEGVAQVAKEEDLDSMRLTTEAGTIGGIPAGGNDFGVTVNADCILDEPTQFDFYDGGGLDVTFLGLAQMDKKGNINVSKFGDNIAGCGGFIDISQNSKKVVFCGTFTSGGFKSHIDNGKIVIDQEGKIKKFVDEVDQITFSGDYALETRQPVLYITERAVFELTNEGIELKEIAPGIDINKDVLDLMDFKPIVKDVKTMDEMIFKDEIMGLKKLVEWDGSLWKDICLLYTSPSPRDGLLSRMPSSA